MWTCVKCGKTEDQAEFRVKRVSYGQTYYMSYCQPCDVVRKREWRWKRKGPEGCASDWPSYRTCTRCQERKLRAAFKHGQLLCKKCDRKARRQRTLLRMVSDSKFATKYRAKQIERKKRRREKPDFRLHERLMRKYKLSKSQYDAMLVAQGGRCAMCQKTHKTAFVKTSRLCVDHNHKTGAVRGLLCQMCNGIVGYCEKHPMTIGLAFKYLQIHEHTNTHVSSVRTPLGESPAAGTLFEVS